MSSQIQHVIRELRRQILTGELAAGERLVELQFAAALNVSRTPLRIAFGELEKEGLLERLPTRGFRVRGFSLDDVAKAVDVRGVLEGLAARILAESGVDAHTLAVLDTCVAQGQALLASAAERGEPIDATGWIAMNRRFHGTLVKAADNPALGSALEAVSRYPMAGAGSLGLSGCIPALEFEFIQRAQYDHEDVVRALRNRESARAQALMQEHAHRSRDNKRALMERLRVAATVAATGAM